MAQQEQQVYKILDSNESNGNNNYYIVQDENERKYVVMHIINGKYCIYDYEFHDIIKVFGTWYANNGTACCILKPQHIEAIPDLPFELNKLVYMHILIKEYCLKEPKQNEKHVLHHINERRRDNRRENLIWVSKNQQRALLKKIGKLAKPPVEIRPTMPYLPKFCKWINAKKAFWIDSHPACFLSVENKQQKHKYIESLKGKKWTIQQKFEDFVKKYEALMAKPFNGFNSYYEFIEHQAHLENTNKAIVMFVTSQVVSTCIGVGEDLGIPEEDTAEDNDSMPDLVSDHDESD